MVSHRSFEVFPVLAQALSNLTLALSVSFRTFYTKLHEMMQFSRDDPLSPRQKIYSRERDTSISGIAQFIVIVFPMGYHVGRDFTPLLRTTS